MSVDARGGRVVFDELTDPEVVHSVLRRSDWNAYTVVAHGSRRVHRINGHAFVDMTDDDRRAAPRGSLALQLHADARVGVHFRDLHLKRLKKRLAGSAPPEDT